MRRWTLGIVLFALTGVSSADDAPKPPPVKEPELQAELIRRAKADQDVRGEITKWMMLLGNKEFADEKAFEATLNANQKAEFQKFAETMQRVDAENTLYLGKVVERLGWPTYSLVGKEGANAAWLLVQHADLSPKFQRKCLDLMAQVPRGEISRRNIAYLTDRVLLAEGKKQVYGTQFIVANGKVPTSPPGGRGERRSAKGGSRFAAVRGVCERDEGLLRCRPREVIENRFQNSEKVRRNMITVGMNYHVIEGKQQDFEQKFQAVMNALEFRGRAYAIHALERCLRRCFLSDHQRMVG